MRRYVSLAILGAALTGCGSGQPDFVETANLPAALVMDEFKAVPSYSSILESAGLGGNRIRLEQSAPDELLFTIPSSENRQGSSFRVTFVSIPGDRFKSEVGCRSTCPKCRWASARC